MPKSAQPSAERADAKNVRLGFAYTKEIKNILKKLGLLHKQLLRSQAYASLVMIWSLKIRNMSVISLEKLTA